MGGNNEFLKILKEKNIWKNYPACKELSLDTACWRKQLPAKQEYIYLIIHSYTIYHKLFYKIYLINM